MANSERKIGKRPKLLSPINSFEGAVKVIHAGADEVYCGIGMPGKTKHFVLYRGPGVDAGQALTYDDLGRIVEYAHRRHPRVNVILVANEPFMSEALERETRDHLNMCIDKGVDALIIGDIGVLSIVKDMGVDVPLYASTYFASMNREATDFLRKLGFSRVILERQLTIQEISEIVKHSKVDVEVFCHGGGCSNINANCYLYHYGHPQLWYHFLKEKEKWVVGGAGCLLVHDVHDVGDEYKKIDHVPILDAASICSLCYFPALVQTGVSGLKIEGRFTPVQFQEQWTRFYRELLDLMWRSRVQLSPEILQKKIDSLIQDKDEPRAGKLWREIFCKQKRCYYSPFFNAPYKLSAS